MRIKTSKRKKIACLPFCAFYAFYAHKKHLKGENSLVCVLCFFVLFMLFMLFVRVKSSCKKKIKRFKIALIPSSTILLSFFQFMANLEQSGCRIPDTWCVKLKFSIIVTFYLTKTKNRAKNLQR